ncbi:hypothetical protein DLR60_18800 [Vibrio tarriae]|uniref:hypothetical protein n=1 Tax=Vibrio tarriae TaxID=2014742 RepID=UPI000DE3472F|nr:hypothetical protein [Vibrio tarriae]RBM65621.1 hypothetical protein DLR60_18800 [Vibrio tarriae]
MHQTNNWIIDADIARGAGTIEHPISKNCRDFLDFVRTNGHQFSADPKIREEWRNHQSLYSKQWFSSMIARKKIKFVVNSIDVDSKINSAPVSDRIKAIALKDSHLVQTSLEHGAVIASGDENAKNAFCDISNSYLSIKGLLWLNPKVNFCLIQTKIANKEQHDPQWQIA